MKVNCKTCNKEFDVKPSRYKKGYGRYCSHSCVDLGGNVGFQKGHKIFLGRKHSEATKEKMRIAGTGRKHTEETKQKIRALKTGGKATEETKRKMSETRKGEGNSFFGKEHSIETREKLSAYRSGENNHNWKGGVTPLHKKVRSNYKYRMWKKAVKERDNYTCVWCDSKENIEADHIKSFAYYPELKYEITNGRSLCNECHKKTETYGQVQKMREAKNTL